MTRMLVTMSSWSTTKLTLPGISTNIAAGRTGEHKRFERSKGRGTLRTFDEVEALCMPDEFDLNPEDFEDKEQKQSESEMRIRTRSCGFT
jgi:hypothetical protein